MTLAALLAADSSPLTIAIVSGVLAVVGISISAGVAWLSTRDHRRLADLERQLIAAATKLGEAEVELTECKRARLWLRQQNEVVIGAILGLLPEDDRLGLLKKLGDDVPGSHEH